MKMIIMSSTKSSEYNGGMPLGLDVPAWKRILENSDFEKNKRKLYSKMREDGTQEFIDARRGNVSVYAYKDDRPAAPSEKAVELASQVESELD